MEYSVGGPVKSRAVWSWQTAGWSGSVTELEPVEQMRSVLAAADWPAALAADTVAEGQSVVRQELADAEWVDQLVEEFADESAAETGWLSVEAVTWIDLALRVDTVFDFVLLEIADIADCTAVVERQNLVEKCLYYVVVVAFVAVVVVSLFLSLLLPSSAVLISFPFLYIKQLFVISVNVQLVLHLLQI